MLQFDCVRAHGIYRGGFLLIYDPWVEAGGWTRPTSKYPVSGGTSTARLIALAATWRYSYAPQSCTDDQFVEMLNAYRGSGELALEENLLALSSRRCGLDADTLANWIAERQLIGFEWQSRTWLPIFQFNLFDMTRPPALGQVLAELIPVYDPWELANWFAQPNPWLADRVPADALEHDPSAVLQAARADRFIANN